METRLQSHYESLSRVIRFTRMADTKAGAVLALQFVLAGVLAAQFDQVLVAKVWAVVTLESGEFCDIVFTGVTVMYLLATLIAVGLAVGVYVPATPKTGRSLIYFRDIADLDCQQFIESAKAMDAAEIERQLLEQIYRVSCIARRKMSLVHHALGLSMASVLTGIVLLAVSGPSPTG